MNKNKIKKYIVKGLPENWYDYAFELKDAAEELWKRHSNRIVAYNTQDDGFYIRGLYSRTYFLLLGLAIENLIKGILISENPKLIENGRISSEISSGHNLVKLSKKIISIQFTLNEMEIFEILSDVIPYWGKYPIPKNFTQLKDEKFMDKDWFKKLLKIYYILEEHLLKLNFNGIDGPNGIYFPKLRVIDKNF